MAAVATHHVAIVNALKASGVVVRVRPDDFLTILARIESPLVVTAQGGVLRKRYQYLTSYKGFAFVADTPTPLMLPRTVETVLAEKIWVPH